MQVSRGVVVASIQIDLDEDVLVRFQKDLLDRIHETRSRGVILDVSGLETLDAEEFAALRRTIAMTALLGAESVLVGLPQLNIVVEQVMVQIQYLVLLHL